MTSLHLADPASSLEPARPADAGSRRARPHARSFRSVFATLVVVLLLTLAGCGPSRPAVAPVGGRITLGGQPVTTGAITFYPVNGRPAAGLIGPDGRYTLGTFAQGDGAIPGGHVVVIESRTVSLPKNRPAAAPVAALPANLPDDIRRELEAGPPLFAPGEVTWLVPEKYAAQATTPLRAEVQPGRNTIDFDIPSLTK
jgi:hypothetical protein